MLALVIPQICNRHPPFGNTITEMITRLPKYEMAIDQQVSTDAMYSCTWYCLVVVTSALSTLSSERHELISGAFIINSNLIGSLLFVVVLSNI